MKSSESTIQILKKGGVVVMPTDTLYGIVGPALDESVVSRIYSARKRNPEKPCIILIGDVSELTKFSVTFSDRQKQVLNEYWSTTPTSIILDCLDEKFAYLHRGTNTLAFRLPTKKDLQNFLKETGPLVAPSANIEGLPPASNIEEAKKYFGDLVDFYVDGGEIQGKASRVIKLHKDGSVDIIRP